MAKETGVEAVLLADGLGKDALPGPAEQLSFLSAPAGTAAAGAGEGSGTGANDVRVMGVGRPAGALNRRTRDVVDLIRRQHGSPLQKLARFWAGDTAVLAKEMDCTLMAAAQFQAFCARISLPYLEQQLPRQVHVTNDKHDAYLIINSGELGSPQDLERALEAEFRVMDEGDVESEQDQ